MWMRQYIHGRNLCRLNVNGTCMVHKDKRAYHPAKAKRKYSTNLHPWRDGCFTGFNYNIRHKTFFSMNHEDSSSKKKNKVKRIKKFEFNLMFRSFRLPA